MNNTISDRLRTLVSNNELKEAIDVILSLYKDTPEDKKNFTNETILLKQQLTTWNQLYITGQEPASKDKARIAYSILLRGRRKISSSFQASYFFARQGARRKHSGATRPTSNEV